MEDQLENDPAKMSERLPPGSYEKPWRIAMAKGPRSIDHSYTDMERIPSRNQNSHSGTILSPK